MHSLPVVEQSDAALGHGAHSHALRHTIRRLRGGRGGDAYTRDPHTPHGGYEHHDERRHSMAGVKAYGDPTWTQDLRHLVSRGKTVGEAAAELGMSRATAFRLLREHKSSRGNRG